MCTECLLVCLQDGFVAATATRLTSAEKDIDYGDVVIMREISNLSYTRTFGWSSIVLS